MTRRSKGPGYVAVQRDLFDHPLFQGDIFTRREAWLWLFANAAWRPRAQRGPWGRAHVERGEIVLTLRHIARIWGWSKSAAHRYLDRLSQEGMITTRKSGTADGTADGTEHLHQITIVTICNYEKFQNQLTGGTDDEGQRLGQRAGQREPENPVIPGLLRGETSKTIQTSLERQEVANGGKRRPTAADRPLPADGLTAKGLRFCHYGSQLWAVYAGNYRDVHGADPMPANYANGRGRWFKQHGETGRPGDLWTADRIEQANAAVGAK